MKLYLCLVYLFGLLCCAEVMQASVDGTDTTTPASLNQSSYCVSNLRVSRQTERLHTTIQAWLNNQAEENSELGKNTLASQYYANLLATRWPTFLELVYCPGLCEQWKVMMHVSTAQSKKS